MATSKTVVAVASALVLSAFGGNARADDFQPDPPPIREAGPKHERNLGMVLSLAGAVPLTWGAAALAESAGDTGDFAGVGRIPPFTAVLTGALLAAIFVPIWIHGQYRLTAVRDERRKLLAPYARSSESGYPLFVF